MPRPLCCNKELSGNLNMALMIAVSPPTCTTNARLCAEGGGVKSGILEFQYNSSTRFSRFRQSLFSV